MKDILLIEDEEVHRILYEAELSQMGCSIRLAENGNMALKMFNEQRPDLIILDVMMPGISFIAIIREIHIKDPSVPIIINTAYSLEKEDIDRLAIEKYIIKSSDLRELKNAVRKLIQ
jgi:DNA-binding response OmpR family regulator